MTFKQYVTSILAKVKVKKTAVVGAVAAATPVILSVGACAETSGTGSSSGGFEAPMIADAVTGAMFNQILDQMYALVPLLLPVVVGCLAFRKGISFLKSMVMGA